MHGTGRHFAALAAALGLTLAACGGGGGAPPTVSMPQPSAPTEAARDDTLSASTAVPEEWADAAATTGTPRFGSVTQSTNRDAAGVTTDRARAAFADGRLSVTVERQGKSALTLDSAHAAFTTPVVERRYPDGEQIAGRSWGALNLTGTEATLSRLAAVWTTSGAADRWAALGYWIHLTGAGFGFASPRITGVEYGAFIDGPEFRSPPESLPSLGTATYTGNAVGFYFLDYGTDVEPLTPRGSLELGEFTGSLRLTADFSDNTVSGCMGLGCTERIEAAGYLIDGATGVGNTFSVTSDIRADFGAAQIDRNGMIGGGSVTLSAPGLRFVSNNGSWGGKFSNIPVSTGEPSGLGGTALGNSTTSGGSRLYFVGAFGVDKQ